MQILHDEEAFACAIASWSDPDLVLLIRARLDFYAEMDESIDEVFKLILVEPGDTLEDVDHAMEGSLLRNPFSGGCFGQLDFMPPYESLEDHPTFYAMLFCLGGGDYGIEIVVPKADGIDDRLLNLCAEAHQTAP